MKTDVQIAQEASLLPITEIAARLGVEDDELELYGKHKAKLSLSVLDRLKDKPDGKLILVTAINPTPAGEGKTTVNVGLSMALCRIGKKALTTLREPSLGPCFGIKGGAAGGGYAQVLPMEDINLHFTGDFHAISAAHNLLAAMVDNHIFHGNELHIDPERVVWKRVVDMNDRALRRILLSPDGKAEGGLRRAGFDITVASEIMAILCLAVSFGDLKERLSRMIVAYTKEGAPVTADMLGATGSLALLLKDAIKPNLVQTVENTPAIIHGGPFANIAHGCNSVMATRISLKLADYVVTEAGFGADLGAEKFFDIKCRLSGLTPSLTVLVATIKALKLNGGVPKEALAEENLPALEEGCRNLEQHIENIKKFGVPVVVAINRFEQDTEREIELLRRRCALLGAEVVLTDVFREGGKGGEELARAAVELCEREASHFHPVYPLEGSIREKIETIAREIYRADGVDFTPEAEGQMRKLEALGFSHLPVCMAKTQYSFSDDPAKLGAPRGFRLTIRELRVSAGAGFLVALTGSIMTMPGLPKAPAAVRIDISPEGEITGLS